MTSKNLTVIEEAHNKLLKAKKGNESFSEVIERLLEGKKDLMSFEEFSPKTKSSGRRQRIYLKSERRRS
jgi:predicted CopG family antitoxin